MDFIIALHKYLSESAKLNECISNRLYPLLLPQQPKLPAIVYTPLSASYGRALQKETGFVKERVQFSMHDKTYGKARELSRVLKGLLKDFKGNMNGINVQATHLVNDISSNTNTAARYSAEEYICIIEYEFNYTEQEE